MNIQNVKAEIGNYIQPDNWKIGQKLTADNGYSDSSFLGCQFRLSTDNADFAVNIKVTGRKINYDGMMPRVRVEIEFVNDGEVSTKTNGWMTI